jgi:6-phosphogluconate dehydrogenase
MKIGYIGLGRMGKNMVLHLLENGIKVVAWNRSPEPLAEVVKAGAVKAMDIKDLVAKLPNPKIIWLMLPAGEVTDEYVDKLIPLLSKGDLVIDGSNSFYRDSSKRGVRLARKKIRFMDIGVSGGIYGARNGACLMIGGQQNDFKEVEGVFKAAAQKDAYRHVGSAGAGHFVKMVHNGIEYGMMGAIAEGFAAINKYKKDLQINLKDVAHIYQNGSIVEGKLSSLMQKVVEREDFEKASGFVPVGETESEMKKLESLSEMPILEEARKMRVRSRGKESYEGKILSLLRNEFGGHAIKKNTI